MAIIRQRSSFLIVSTIFIAILAMSCKKCPTEPEKEDVVKTDTTSHSITWYIDTLKTSYVSSIIHDVAVIDENNIWAVGEFYAGDSVDPNGLTKPQFNIAFWNGTQWNYEWLYCNGIYYAHELFGIMGFSNNDIWITDGSLFHWNGATWTSYHPWNMGLLNENEGGIHAMQGASPDDVYFVGHDGVILHWNGSLLSRITSPTSKNLASVAGTKDVIWACGGSTLVEYRSGKWTVKELPSGWPGSIGDYKACGAFGDTLYIAGQYCLLVEPVKKSEKRKLITYSWIDESDAYDVEFSFNDILVLGYTDIFFSNGRGNIYHYNGSTLHKYPMELDGYMTGIDGKDDIVVAVGYDSKTAYVFRGYR